MTDFKQIYDALVAGIDTFYYIPVEDIEVFPELSSLAVEEYEIQLKAGKSWKIGFAIDDTLAYAEPAEDTPNGRIYNKQLQGILPHDHLDIAQNFFDNQYAKYLVKYVDRTGVRRLLGTVQEPMRIRFSFKQAGNHSGEKGWSFSFYGTHTTPGHYLQLPELPQLWIQDGYLYYAGGMDENFALVNGYLQVTGDQEDQYSMVNGKVIFDPNG